jgi:hypothetical protein
MRVLKRGTSFDVRYDGGLLECRSRGYHDDLCDVGRYRNDMVGRYCTDIDEGILSFERILVISADLLDPTGLLVFCRTRQRMDRKCYFCINPSRPQCSQCGVCEV